MPTGAPKNLVIPNRAESPVRNLLHIAGATAAESADYLESPQPQKMYPAMKQKKLAKPDANTVEYQALV